MQVFLIAWCCWKKTPLTIKLLFVSLCLQHFNPRKEFHQLLSHLHHAIIELLYCKMSNLSFSSSGLLSVIRRKGVSISIFSSSISSFIILFMINLFWKYKTVDFFDVQHFLPISLLEHLSYLSKVIGIWILHHPLKVYTDLKNVEL